MSEAPDWLLTMRVLTDPSMKETPGTANNDKILAMADEIARLYPEMQSYCDQYNSDAIPWCGLMVAYTMAKANIRPPFVAGNDTDCFLWARSWSDDPNYEVLKVPRLGCIVVLTRSGGGHVSLYESTSGNNYMLRGGNQSDAVTVAAFPRSSVVAMVWPKDGPAPPPLEPPVDAMPVLRKGSTGRDVAYLQQLLPKWVDGDFGTTTESLVKEFQRTQGLAADGVVGELTWAALLDEEPPPPPLPPASGWMHGITATVFGNYEGEQSAYGGELDDSQPFVALPMRFTGERPIVEVMNEDGELVEAEIMDVGPWMVDDRAYVIDGKRPVAEQCYASKTPIPSGPQKGRVPSNPAGIDLSPSLAKALGIEGMGKVSWRLVP